MNKQLHKKSLCTRSINRPVMRRTAAGMLKESDGSVGPRGTKR